MNGALATNDYILDKKLFYEGVAKVQNARIGKFSRNAVLFLGIAWAVMAVVTLVMNQSPLFLVLEFAVVFVAALWILFYLPRYKASKAWKAMASRCGDDLRRQTGFYDDHLEICAAGEVTTVDYDEIVQTLDTERLWILITNRRVGVMIKKDSFTGGSLETARSLVENAQEND